MAWRFGPASVMSHVSWQGQEFRGHGFLGFRVSGIRSDGNGLPSPTMNLPDNVGAVCEPPYKNYPVIPRAKRDFFACIGFNLYGIIFK
jgi:hypothetical protein